MAQSAAKAPAGAAVAKRSSALTSNSTVPQKPLAVPAVERKHFARNFLKTAVCELRFPTLLELDSPRPPLEFARALRHEYPTQEVVSSLNLGTTAKQAAHVFKSKKGLWAVTLRTSSLALETSRYDSFDEFESRIGMLVEACQSFIDSDFFTRIGVRYVNAFPYDREAIAEWINPELVGSLHKGAFGDAIEFSQQVRGTTEVGGFLMQHGIVQDGKEPSYGLDLDFYAEDVDVKSAMQVVRELHKRQFDLFMWAVAGEAKRRLEVG
jgi:uncharacterized protein (TIGR04255 family)